jgi:gamma-carbonic anhydrase
MISSFDGKTPRIAADAYVAPGAVIIGDVSIGRQASIWFSTVLRGDINSVSIGDETNIQDGCILHVTGSLPVTVGARVTVGHGAILHACTIGDDCLIGMGAIVLDGAVVESGSMVGAGALVPPGKRVNAGSLVIGSPSWHSRNLSPEDKVRIQESWQNYVEYARRFAREIKS